MTFIFLEDRIICIYSFHKTAGSDLYDSLECIQFSSQ